MVDEIRKSGPLDPSPSAKIATAALKAVDGIDEVHRMIGIVDVPALRIFQYARCQDQDFAFISGI